MPGIAAGDRGMGQIASLTVVEVRGIIQGERSGEVVEDRSSSGWSLCGFPLWVSFR